MISCFLFWVLSDCFCLWWDVHRYHHQGLPVASNSSWHSLFQFLVFWFLLLPVFLPPSSSPLGIWSHCPSVLNRLEVLFYLRHRISLWQGWIGGQSRLLKFSLGVRCHGRDVDVCLCLSPSIRIAFAAWDLRVTEYCFLTETLLRVVWRIHRLLLQRSHGRLWGSGLNGRRVRRRKRVTHIWRSVTRIQSTNTYKNTTGNILQI